MALAVETKQIGPVTHLEPVRHTRETLDHWITWINDPEIRQWMYRDLPRTPEDINKWLYQASHDPLRHYFSIRQNGELVGFISLRQDQAPKTTGEIGIIIGPKELRGNGLGKHAVDTVLDYARDELRLSSVRALIKPNNERSIRLFTGRGFTHTDNVTANGDVMMRFEKSLETRTPQLDEARKYFSEAGLETPDTDELVKASREYARQLVSGGTEIDPTSSLMMIDTMLTPPDPDKLKEQKGRDILVIEFGGSNIRIANGHIDDAGQPSIASYEDGSPKKAEGTLTRTHYNSPEEMFEDLFRVIDATEATILPDTFPETVGIVWSFPGYAEKTPYGVDVHGLVSLTKEIYVQGMDKVLVGQAMMEAIRNRYYPNTPSDALPRIAVMNDTPAVLFYRIAARKGANQVGIVDGTGFNIALLVNGTTFNTESGSYTGLPLPPYAQALEHTYENAGRDLAEKQCAGLYIGDQLDSLVGQLIDRKLLHGVKNGRMEARDLSRILGGDMTIIEQKLGHSLTVDERTILTELAVRLRNRAALVVGMLAGTAVRTFGDGFADRVSVPVEGAFFVRTPGMQEISTVIASSIAGRPVTFEPGRNLGIIGAVAAAASV